MPDENHQKPRAILVHNPSVSDCLNGITKANHLDLLFANVPKPGIAAKEHRLLTELLSDQGVKIIELFDLIDDSDKQKLRDNPNIIFTRDPLVTLPWAPKLGIIAKMQLPIRQYEARAIEHIVDKLGLTDKLELPVDGLLEGGDVMPLFINGKRILIIHTGGRSNHQAVEFLANHQLSICDEIIEVKCKKNVLHLDSMMGFAGSKILVFDPSSVNSVHRYSNNENILLDLEDYLARLGIEALHVSYDEADRLQSTNYINLGNNTIVAYSGSRRIIKQLRLRGIKVLDFDGHELAKGRGGPRCLSRPIY